MELPRSRDCVVLVKGDTLPVVVGEDLAVSGWLGGQGVRYIDPLGDDLTVGASTGSGVGFLLWGSNESADQFTSTTRSQPYYRFATLCFGGWQILTSTYEKYTYTSRQSGPLVEVVYNHGDRLRFSLRGYFTKEDEFTLSGDPRAPNSLLVGYVSQVPSAITSNYMGIQVSM
jgi:hypothetical protein